jgi:hypothetical protein
MYKTHDKADRLFAAIQADLLRLHASRGTATPTPLPSIGDVAERALLISTIPGSESQAGCSTAPLRRELRPLTRLVDSRGPRSRCTTVPIGKGTETVLHRFSFFRFYNSDCLFIFTYRRTYEAEDAPERAATTPAAPYNVRL